MRYRTLGRTAVENRCATGWACWCGARSDRDCLPAAPPVGSTVAPSTRFCAQGLASATTVAEAVYRSMS
jgi:hypothetical protein